MELEELLLDPILRQLLEKRGLEADSDIESFFNGDLGQIGDLLKLYDIKSAAKRIEKAIAKKEKVVIYGDFDADGLAATAILWEYLFRKRGAEVKPYIPSRFEEGYGLNDGALAQLKKQAVDLIVTVDCGIRDVELVDRWRRKGLDFIITDHHQPGDEIPNCMVVHPQYPKHEHPLGKTSGAMVALILIYALEISDGAKSKQLKLDQLEGFDLAALSLVTDVMPLLGGNRILLKKGLEKLRKTKRVGLRALVSISGIELKDLDTYHLGFVLGPRINAAGRIGDPLDALRLLTTQNQAKASELASKMNKWNQQRQQMTGSLMEEVGSAVKNSISSGNRIHIVYGQDWNEGIIGLVAGKLQEVYKDPIVVVSVNKEEARGSARSFENFDIISLLDKANKLMNKYGGHRAAAGFSLDPANLEEFIAFLQAEAHQHKGVEDEEPKAKYDVEVDISNLSRSLYDKLLYFEPFGYGNPKPKFYLKEVGLYKVRPFGSQGQHLNLSLMDPSTKLILPAVYFNGVDNNQLLTQGQNIDLIGYLDLNRWQGREELRLVVKEIVD